MTEEKVDKLLGQLLEATTSGKVSWNPTMTRDYFRANLDGGFVEIGLQQDWDSEVRDYVGPHYPILVVYNEGGHVVAERTKPRSLLEQLHQSARRDALDADQVLDRMLNQLAEVRR